MNHDHDDQLPHICIRESKEKNPPACQLSYKLVKSVPICNMIHIHFECLHFYSMLAIPQSIDYSHVPEANKR